MAEFLETEAIDIDIDATDDNNSEGKNIATVSDDEFIDDSEQPQNFYPYFTNVSRSYDDAMRDYENVEDPHDFEARHYCYSDEEEEKINEFPNFQAKVKLFRESLINPHGLENPDSFFYSILYAIRFKKTEKKDFLEDEEILKQDVGLALSHDLFEIKS